MACPGENSFARWLDRELPAEESERLDAHLDGCARCRSLLADLARASLTTGAELGSGAGACGLDLREGRVVDGKFRIERTLGSGGMGVVVAAEHLVLRQRVALKFIRPEAVDGVAIARFVREARIAARLAGPHVVRVLDLGGLDDGTPYIVMEYLEGEDLEGYLARGAPLPVAEAIALLAQACDGVAEAHAAGLVHRDLKPGNLFLERRAGGPPGLKVLDFGISKAVGAGDADNPGLTGSASAMGSPLFAAPEQLLSARDVDQRADVWALGVIGYQMLAGRRPFATGSLPQVIAQVLHSSPRPLAELRPELPRALVAIIERCMAREPSHRFADVEALRSALARCEAPAARSRRPLVLAVTGAAVVALLGTGAVLLGGRSASMTARPDAAPLATSLAPVEVPDAGPADAAPADAGPADAGPARRSGRRRRAPAVTARKQAAEPAAAEPAAAEPAAAEPNAAEPVAAPDAGDQPSSLQADDLLDPK